ncbi:MAG TPA: hypothetical protein VMU14_05735 [Acidimicrobiales bacterium]|nr:hypothetical protein [Acidimicrobiales bacterium]
MSELALFFVGFVIAVVAFGASLCYAYALFMRRYDLDREGQRDDVQERSRVG